MPIDDTVVLATACLNQRALGQRPARTLLVGAAVLTVQERFGTVAFKLQADSTTVTDNAADTMLFLADAIGSPERLLVWRAEDIVVPSLVAAAETARDAVAAAKLLRALNRAFDADVVDVATTYGNPKSFDATSHEYGLPFQALPARELEEMHRTGCHGRIRDHLTTRATTTLKLWLRRQADLTELDAATDAWLAEQALEVAA